MTLEEILVHARLLSEDQLGEALACQAQSGGELDDHLLRLGYLGEKVLRGILAEASGHPVIDVSDLQVDPEVLAILPADLAWRRRVLPIEFSQGSGLLRVVCKHPVDSGLVHELTRLAGVREVDLNVALGTALDTAILEHYRDSFGQFRVSSDSTADSEHIDDSEAEPDVDLSELDGNAILLVSPDYQLDAYLWKALARENTSVVAVESETEAIQALSEGNFCALLIKDTDRARFLELINRFRKQAPTAPIRHFKSAMDLIAGDSGQTVFADLLQNNLSLFTSLLISEDKLSSDHSQKVGALVDRLCRLIGLSDEHRMLVTNAAYLHELARMYFGESSEPNWEHNLIELSAKSLELRRFPRAVVDIIRSMYKEIANRPLPELTFTDVAGNIVTIVDFYLDHWPDQTKLTTDQFETVKQTLRNRTDNLFLREVVEHFLQLLRREEVTVGVRSPDCNALILDETNEDHLMLEHCLLNLGFDVTMAHSVDQCLEFADRDQPHIIVIKKSGDAAEVTDLVKNLVSRGLPVSQVPTFVMVDGASAQGLYGLFSIGVEDIIPIDHDLDPLLVKMNRIRSRLNAETDQRIRIMQDMGTHGSLEDMNVIDLLQAMGSSGKTVRISITARGKQLTIVLVQGKIIHAECDELLAEAAVIAGLQWDKGVWSVDPISTDELPEPNIFRSIDSILIEGVHVIDQQKIPGSGVIPAETELPD
ncbi:MAG: DUF4388 domain-containing protein [Candidatus Zixiibacteriota bacterium]|nr:MAG: DUF4388 domain-containing protein [candidate division Zixibacteria bacterium]